MDGSFVRLKAQALLFKKRPLTSEDTWRYFYVESGCLYRSSGTPWTNDRAGISKVIAESCQWC